MSPFSRSHTKYIARCGRSHGPGHTWASLKTRRITKQRVVDYDAKPDKLQTVQHKATMKNPLYEFCFGIHNTHIRQWKTLRDTQKALQMEREDEIGPVIMAIKKEYGQGLECSP